jgi:hypothetical protein
LGKKIRDGETENRRNGEKSEEIEKCQIPKPKSNPNVK